MVTWLKWTEAHSHDLRCNKQESRAIVGRTARCRCKFRYIDLGYTVLQRQRSVSLPQQGFLVALCLQTADCSELSVN